MARLVHNDYLEQASDSGILAFLAYFGLVFGSLYLLYRYRSRGWSSVLLWAGLLAWAVQSFIEFGLYVPALSWPTFFFFGWSLSQVQISLSPDGNVPNQPR